MSSISKGWATSFIYKQDLTSYYMNNILRSVIRPGIYNANMAVFKGVPTVGPLLSNNQSSLCLKIKKGTTFVFSNDFMVTSKGIRRNFNHTFDGESPIEDRENFCLIKSVALSDMSVMLIGNNTLNDGIYSIHAFLRYDPLDTNNFDTSVPSFFLLKEDTGEGSSLYSKINDSQKRYPAEINGQALDIIPIADGEDTLPEGYKTSFYLNVGFIKVSSSEVVAFSGRGLPEYRYSPLMDTNTLTPDIIPSFRNDGWVYFDIPYSLIGTTLFQRRMKAKGEDNIEGNDISWEGAYFEKRKLNSESYPPTRFAASDTGVYALYGEVSNIRSFDSQGPSVIEDMTVQTKVCKVWHTAIFPSVTLNFKNWGFEENTGFVPLDISPLNVRYLLESIQGKDVWSYVIDKVRSGNDDPNEVTDIIPMALVSVSNGKIDSSTTVSYMGLQEMMSRVNVLNVREHNIFNVIPVME